MTTRYEVGITVKLSAIPTREQADKLRDHIFELVFDTLTDSDIDDTGDLVVGADPVTAYDTEEDA